MMELRDYQRQSVEAVWTHVREHETNPAVVLPTGSGKTHAIEAALRPLQQDGVSILLPSHRTALGQALAARAHTLCTHGAARG